MMNMKHKKLERITDDNVFYITHFIKGLKLAREVAQKKLSV